MKYFFQLDGQWVSDEARAVIGDQTINQLKEYLSASSFDSQESYNTWLAGLMDIVKASGHAHDMKKDIFTEELAQVEKKTPLIEKTPWGLVSIQQVSVPENHIEKYLVVKQHGILGFEYHERKHEKLDIKEGMSMIIYANHAAEGYTDGQMKAHIGAPGDTYEFLPYDEHGMIALTDSVILETSTNDLDDLIFIYDSAQVI